MFGIRKMPMHSCRSLIASIPRLHAYAHLKIMHISIICCIMYSIAVYVLWSDALSIVAWVQPPGEVGGGWLGGGWLGHGSEARIVSEDRGCSACQLHAHRHVFGREIGNSALQYWITTLLWSTCFLSSVNYIIPVNLFSSRPSCVP